MDRLKDLKTDDPVNTDDPVAAPVDPADIELGTDSKSASNDSVVADQLKLYEPIRATITATNRATEAVRKLFEEQTKAASEQAKQFIVKKMNSILAETQAAGLITKRRLDEIGKDNAAHAKANPGSSTAQIRHSMFAKHTREFQASVREFEGASGQFKKGLQDATRRQLKNIGLDEKKIEEVVESGQAQKVLEDSISGDLQDVLDSIQQRHASIMALERSVREVQELFIDLAHLVNESQEYLDSIEKHIEATENYVVKGEENLQTAESDQTAARKKQCCIVVIVVIVLMVVIGGPVLQAVNVF